MYIVTFAYIRTIFVVAKDGQLPLVFSGVNRYYKSPNQSVLLFVRLAITSFVYMSI